MIRLIAQLAAVTGISPRELAACDPVMLATLVDVLGDR